MSYGLAIYRSNGNLAFSSDSVTWNQVDYVYVPANGSFSNTYSIFEGKEILCAQLLIDTYNGSSVGVSHTITISGTTYSNNGFYPGNNVISISGGNVAAYVMVLVR